MEDDLYDPEVNFRDPLIALTGVDKYKSNVEMLAGSNPVGRLLFSDCGLWMHAVDEPTPETLTTRWTLQFRFRLLPWAPLAQFTGISKYTLTDEGKVATQRDFWDSINLRPGGDYEPTSKLEALLDFAGQLAPGGAGAGVTAGVFMLLRRAAGYEVRRYERPDGSAEVVAVLRPAAGEQEVGHGEAALRRRSAELEALLRRDGLLPPGDEVVPGAVLRADEVHLPLAEHPW